MTSTMVSFQKSPGQLLLLLCLHFLLSWANHNMIIAQAKVVTGNFRFSHSQSDHRLLASFAVVPIGASVEITIESTDSEEMTDMYSKSLLLRAYRDTDWVVHKTNTNNNDNNIVKGSVSYCHSTIQHSKRSSPIQFEYNPTTQKWIAQSTLLLRNLINSADETSRRSHYWYFVIDDCSFADVITGSNSGRRSRSTNATTITTSERSRKPKLSYTLSMENYLSQHRKYQMGIQPKTHFSADQMYLERTHIIGMIVSALVVVLLLYPVMNHVACTTSATTKKLQLFKQQHNNSTCSNNNNNNNNNNKPYQIHIAVLWVAAAAAIDSVSSLLELIHLDVYYYNGIGVVSFDAAAAYCEAFCDALLILFLLSIASGWTLPETTVTIDPQAIGAGAGAARIMTNPIQSIVTGFRKPFSTKVDSTGSKMCGGIILIHLGLAQWGRAYNDIDQESYHDYAHMPGKVLMLIRVFLGMLMYIVTTNQTNSATTMTYYGTSQRLKRFYTIVGIVGFVWFQSIPLLTFVSNYIVPYYIRLPTVLIGTCIFQNMALLVLAWLVSAQTEESSAFHQYSRVGSVCKYQQNLDYVSTGSLLPTSCNRNTASCNGNGSSISSSVIVSIFGTSNVKLRYD